jgi:hypothetical protein
MNQSFSETMLASETIRRDLIRTEIEIGLTFAQIALQSKDLPEKRRRNALNARTAYETALRLTSQTAMEDTDAIDLSNRAAILRAHLEDLGEKLL